MSGHTSASTIPSLKQSFLNSQTTLLAQPLAPSRSWQANNDASDEAIPERVLQDALFQLNQNIQQHCRRVYAPQASRNIAEQINDIYNKDAERRVGGEADADGGIGRELDLTEKDAIDSLPATWHSEKEVNDYAMESKRYEDGVKQLSLLNEQRQQLLDQISHLNRLKSVADPLQTTGNGVGIQENLLTRNGAVEKELERMRFLLARVGGRVHALPQLAQNDAHKEVDVTEFTSLGRKRRVDDFLADDKVFPS